MKKGVISEQALLLIGIVVFLIFLGIGILIYFQISGAGNPLLDLIKSLLGQTKPS